MHHLHVHLKGWPRALPETEITQGQVSEVTYEYTLKNVTTEKDNIIYFSLVFCIFILKLIVLLNTGSGTMLVEKW